MVLVENFFVATWWLVKRGFVVWILAVFDGVGLLFSVDFCVKVECHLAKMWF